MSPDRPRGERPPVPLLILRGLAFATLVFYFWMILQAL